jgi:hypothetical protein
MESTQPLLKFGTRMFQIVTVTEKGIIVDGLGSVRIVPFYSLASWQRTRSAYDLPYFESTFLVYTSDGRKVKLKRVPRKHAARLAEILTGYAHS